MPPGSVSKTPAEKPFSTLMVKPSWPASIRLRRRDQGSANHQCQPSAFSSSRSNISDTWFKQLGASSPSRVCARRRQARRRYADVCRSSGHSGDIASLAKAAESLQAGMVLVHEAMLFKSATQEVGARLACQKALLLISKRDLSGDMHPRLYEMGKAISIS